MVEHKLELIAEYAENILVLDEGEIILSGKASEVLNNKILLEKRNWDDTVFDACL